MADRLFLKKECPYCDREEHGKGEPEGDEWYHTRPIVVDDSFKHDRVGLLFSSFRNTLFGGDFVSA